MSTTGYDFTTITPPAGTPAGDTLQALSINNKGEVLFSALNPAGGFNDVDVDDIYDAKTGVFTAIPQFPGSDANTTLANGINTTCDIVGQYSPPDAIQQAFELAGGGFTDLTAGGTDFNFAVSISNNGQVTGDAGTATIGLGFIFAHGAYSFFAAADPTAFFTTGEGINNAGTVVGVAGLLTGGGISSFIDKGGVVSPFAVPGSLLTEVTGINDKGQIVGVYIDDFGNIAGFVDTGGVFSTVQVPGAIVTVIQGINNKGDIVGEYVDAQGNEQAFVASPTHGHTHSQFVSAMATVGATPAASPPVFQGPNLPAPMLLMAARGLRLA